MKHTIKILLLVMVCALSIMNVPSAHSISYNNSEFINLTGGSIHTNNVYQMTANNGKATIDRAVTDTSLLNYIALNFNGTIPKNSIVSVIIRFARDISTGTQYPNTGWTSKSSAYSLINSSTGDFGYNYISLYTDANISNELDIFTGANVSLGNHVYIDVSNISYTTLNEEPTKEQIDTIGATLNNIYSTISGMITDTSNVSDKIDQIAIDTATQTEIEEDREEREQEDRDNLEERKDDTDTEANEAGSDASQTGQTLFQAFGQFVTALTNISGTSCRLPDMQIYSLTLNNLDLCQFNIPPSIMALASIGMVFIIVPLGIHLVKKMLNLYKEITG